MNAPVISARDWGLLLTLSVLWGGSYFFTGVAVQSLPTFSIVVSRVALAAVILHVVLRATGQRFPVEPQVLLAFLGMGMLNNVVPFSLIVWGQSQLASGVASILNAMTPVFAVLVAHWLTHDEKLTAARLVGVVAGLAGVTVMMGADAARALGDNVAAQLACLGAALSYAFAGVFGRRFRAMGVTPLATATGQVSASSMILVPLMLVVDRPWTLAMPPVTVIAALVALAGASTALAYIIYFRVLATAGATNLMLVTLLLPVTAITLGVLVLGESLGLHHALGMALIALGLLAIDGRAWRHLRRATSDGNAV